MITRYYLMNDLDQYGEGRNIGGTKFIEWHDTIESGAMVFRQQADAESWLPLDAEARVVKAETVHRWTVLPRPDAEPKTLRTARLALAHRGSGRENNEALFGPGLAYIETTCGAVGIVRQIPTSVTDLTGAAVVGIDLTPGNVIADAVALDDIAMSATVVLS